MSSTLELSVYHVQKIWMPERVRRPAQWTSHFSLLEKKQNQSMKIIGYIPDGLVKEVDELMSE